MNRRKMLVDLWPFTIAAMVIVLDQFTKLWVVREFLPFEHREVIPGLFDLVYLTNTGAAFGILAGQPTVFRQVFFVGVALAALVILFFSYRHFQKQGMIFVHAIGLIAGGALGNLIDRLRLNAVIDFLDFYVKGHHWPAFNVADSAITVGVGLFLLGGLLNPDKGGDK